MRNLFQFIKVYHFVLLFILAETFSLFLYFSNHQFQQSKLFSLTQEYTGAIYNYYNNIHEYLNLRSENDYLKRENAKLYSILSKDHRQDGQKSLHSYIPARIVKNSIDRDQNILIINKGKKDGVEAGMGIRVENGIIGIIKSTSDNYSKAISVLNQRSEISIVHNNSHQNGYLRWRLPDHMIAEIINIPNYTHITIGDTIKTNGYSNIFPSGISIGTIESFQKGDESSFYKINMRFLNDMNSTSNVYIVKSLTIKEINGL